MPNGEPLGIFDAVNRDVERIQRALPGPLLPLPAPIGQQAPTAEPRTPVELVQNIPAEVTETVRAGMDLLIRLPAQLTEDLTIALNNLAKAPREVSQELFVTPGRLADRLAPSNINRALETVRESAEFRDVTDPRVLREKMRTITDVLPRPLAFLNLLTPG